MTDKDQDKDQEQQKPATRQRPEPKRAFRTMAVDKDGKKSVK
jgi:hypothetical protein